MKSNRPVNLDLTKFKFPLTAITSIIHRISGVILFLCIPIFLCYLSCSLSSETSFAAVVDSLHNGWGKLITWLILAALLYHFVAGIRHLLMDLGVGETKKSSKIGAVFMLLIYIVLLVLAGVYVW